MILDLTLLVMTFFFMEFMAWFTHKYVMHGFLWTLHKDHHQPNSRIFQANDTFFLIFAIPSMILIFIGVPEFSTPFYIGLGILLYGIAYFFIHDIFIHQRFRMFKKSGNIYLKAIRKAHKIHHKHLSKEDGECFGMLIVPLKYYREFKKTSVKSS